MKKFNPKNDSVMIRPIKEKEEYGDLVLPDFSKKRPMFGIVVEAGPGRFDEKMQTKVGEKVCFPQHVGVMVMFNDEEFVIMSAGSIYGSIDE